jgi:hypothetical protein
VARVFSFEKNAWNYSGAYTTVQTMGAAVLAQE